MAGTLTILASCSVLLYLWQGAKASKNRTEPRFWQTIVFEGWATRLVTICSAAIRVAITFQIGLLIAAIAALVLESGSARFSDLALLSIERALGSSAFGILPATFGQRTHNGLSRIYCLIIATACAIALSSTFISTILLSDFATIQIAAPSVRNVTAVGMISEGVGHENFASYMTTRPMAHWRFAEMNASDSTPTFGDVDTGDVYRALLPFADAESRVSLEHYSGPSVVTNLRTWCVSPTLTNVNLNISSYRLGLPESLHFLGDIAFTVDDIHDKVDTVRCRMNEQWNSTSLGGWAIILCGVQFVNSGFTPEDPSFGLPYEFDYIMLLNSTEFLNGIGFYRDSYEYRVRPRLKELQSQKLTMRKEGAWTKAVLSNGTEVFGASLCLLNNAESQMYNVTMSAPHSAPEPIARWRRFIDLDNDRRILQQLGVGVDRIDFEKRDIADLAIQSEAINFTTPQYHVKWGMNNLLAGALFGDDGGGWSMIHGSPVLGWDSFTAHPAHTALFQNILQETGNPAAAVQALAFTLYRMIYYDWQALFTDKYAVTTVHSTEKLIPVQWRGLIFTLCLVSVHLVIVFTTTVLYAVYTKATLLGNAWQSLAQVVSHETDEAIQGASGMTDKEVKEWAKSTDRNVGGFSIAHSDSRERMEIRRRS